MRAFLQVVKAKFAVIFAKFAVFLIRPRAAG